MDSLLKNDFTSFNRIPVCTLLIKQETYASYFELKDVRRCIQISTIVDFGSAKYENMHCKALAVIDYDGFLTSTPQLFQEGKDRCDVIVYTVSDNSHFLLNELKDSNPTNKVKRKAESQLASTLQELMRVPSIKLYINSFMHKRCCYCNKQAQPPSTTIIATEAFGRVNQLNAIGFKMSNADIEDYGFELYHLCGNQKIVID